jgi:pimeloyl-ACP methyl ester carboxylesterase
MRWLLFGEDPRRDDVRRTVEALQDCPPQTCEAFYWAFPEHDAVAALEHLAAVPVLVACGDRDRLTPLSHSKAIAAALPHAEVVVYPGCGHMLMLERARDVSSRLVELSRAALPTAALRAG